MATRKPTTLNAKPKPKAAAKGGEERELSPQKQLEIAIAEQAQARFVASAAIDAAIAMREAKLPNRNPSAALLKKKGGVKLADIRDELLLRIAEGESVFTICHADHMPNRGSVYRWIREDAQFRVEYESALEQRADKYAEQIADLSKIMHQRAAMGASNEEVTAIKAHINSLQWIAARLNPKKYGDKQSLDIDQKVTLDDKQLDQRLNALIAKAKPKAAE